MTLEANILAQVHLTFGTHDAALAVQELLASGKTGRIARCIVVGANGSLTRLRSLIASAELDPRDVIVAGEYDDAMRHVRDLRVSFAIELPKDCWISEVAVTAFRHGFELVSVESAEIVSPPFAGVEREGTACFSTHQRIVKVRKEAGAWSISEWKGKLAAYGLDSPLLDEERFRIQLDYLLSEADA